MQSPGLHWITETKSTSCPYCGVGCGVSMQCDTKLNISTSGDVIEQDVSLSELEGDISHPANFGKLCVKGSHLLDTNDISDRLLYPQMKGSRASWDEALNAVSAQITSCIDKYGPESIAFYLSGQLLTEDYYIANKLMKGFLGSANVDTNSRLCMSSAVAGYKRSFGADAVPCCYEDLEETELLVLVGSNAAWTHPILFQRMQAALEKNPNRKMVVIDPRKTPTSNAADLHLAIKPGTDAWIYNGLLHFLISNNICDNAFIEKHTNNFGNMGESVSEYTIGAVSEATQLPSSVITQFYQMFASAHSAISFYSMGINQSSSGTDKTNSIINCHLATGKIGKKGCGPFSITGQPNAMGGREVGGLANMLAAHMDIENKGHQSLVKEFWDAPNIVTKNGLKAVDMFDEMAAGKIKFVWIMGTNPVVSMPNRIKIEAALTKCEMVVVSDVVQKNDTLAFADIALPASAWSEKDGTVTNSERRISRQRGIMPLLGESKHDWQIVRDLACKLGLKAHFDFQYAGDIFDEHARLSAYKNSGQRDFDISGLTGMSMSAYDNLIPIQWPVNKKYPKGKKRLFEDGHFYTNNSKANFIEVKAVLPEQITSSEYPFVLNTGRMRDQWHTMTRTGKAQALVEHAEQAFIHMHPKDAEKYNIENNELIALSSSVSEDKPVVAPVIISNDIKVGELFVPIHWSKTNSSHLGLMSLFSSANDPISGQPELKHAAVSFQKVVPRSAMSLAVKKSKIAPDIQLAQYQVRINKGDFWLYLLSEIPSSKQTDTKDSAVFNNGQSLKDRVMKKLSDDIVWLSKADTQGSTNSVLGIQDRALVAYATSTHKSNFQSLLNGTFIRECFEQEFVSREHQQHLLLGTSPTEYQLGKLICSCFKVRKLTIEKAIDEGINTVSMLGETLKCGTNCGSCKTELATLIQENAAQGKSDINNAFKDSVHIPVMEIIK